MNSFFSINLIFYRKNLPTNSFKLFCFLWILGFQLACSSGDAKKDIREFYYPIEALKQPMVYEYQAINNDSLGSEYWYFKTHETDTAIYFTGNNFNRNFEVGQFSSEEVVKNGTIQKDYVLFTYDSLGQQFQIPAEIEYGNTFPFEVKDSNSIFLQKLKWTFSENPLITTTLIRNRRYKGKAKYTYKGKIYDCVEFQLKELIDDFNNGHFEKEYAGKELYAKELGLVYYKKVIDNLILEYELVDIYPMEKLEQKFKASLNKSK
jgi:hypothetical protein